MKISKILKLIVIICFLVLLIGCTGSVSASGHVRDAETGEAIVHAQISLGDDEVYTGELGEFNLRAEYSKSPFATDDSKVIVRKSGYKKKSAKAKHDMEILLKRDTSEESE